MLRSSCNAPAQHSVMAPPRVGLASRQNSGVPQLPADRGLARADNADNLVWNHRRAADSRFFHDDVTTSLTRFLEPLCLEKLYEFPAADDRQFRRDHYATIIGNSAGK